MDRPDGWVYVVAMNQLRDQRHRSERRRERAPASVDGAVDAGSGDTNIVVPEPGSLGLLGTGLIGLAGVIRRKLRG